MSLNIALTYVGNAHAGILMVADSSAASKIAGLPIESTANKTFFTNNIVGVVSGEMVLGLAGNAPTLGDVLAQHSPQFDSITEGATYGHIGTFANSDYGMFVAKLNRPAVDLYSVASKEGHRAKLLLSTRNLIGQPGGKLVYRHSEGPQIVDSERQFDLDSAREFMPILVTGLQRECLIKGYSPGPLIMYSVHPVSGITKLT